MSSFINVLREVVGGQQDTYGTPKRLAQPKSFVQEVVDISDNQEDGDFQIVTLITAEDIRPDTTAANAMSIALQEMSTCKGMFDKWADELDR